MSVCLCQSFKQLLQTDRTTNFFFSHSTRTTTTRGQCFLSVFSFFSFFVLLYRFIFYTNYLGIVLIFRFVCSWLFSPLTSQRLCFSSFSITRLCIRQKCNLQAPSLRFHLYKSKCAKHFSPQRKLPSLPSSLALSLSILLSNNSHETILHIQKEEREIVYRKSHPLSLSFSLQSFVSVDTIFFFRDLSIRSRDRSTSWYVYNVIFTDSLEKILCTVHEDCSVYAEFLRDEDEDLRPLVSLSRLAGNLSCLSCSFSLLSLYHK